MARKTAISRRQFLTGVFRERDAARSETAGISAPARDLAQQRLAEHDRFGWSEDPRVGRDFTAPEASAQFRNWEDEIDSVLEEMENLKGIKDF